MEIDSLKILFEGKDYLIINKPAGITVNKSDTTTDAETLQGLLEGTGKINTSETDQEFVSRGGIVHRLDKETSGVIIVAKNAEAFHKIQDQFKQRRVQKDYIALAHGLITPKTGEIKVPVGRLPWNRKRFGVLAGGRESVTEYEVISEYVLDGEFLSLVRLFPKTGRTHQIRVHLKYIGHPIFADPLYAGRKTARQDRKLLERVFLHAQHIKFEDPESGKVVEYDAPLPDELSDLLEKHATKKDN